GQAIAQRQADDEIEHTGPLALSMGMPVVVMSVMVVPALAGLRLSLERSIQSRGAMVGHILTRADASVVGEHNIQAIFIKNLDRFALEEIAILPKEVRLHAFARDRRGGDDEHLADFLDGHAQAHALARTIAPHSVRLVRAGVFA